MEEEHRDLAAEPKNIDHQSKFANFICFYPKELCVQAGDLEVAIRHTG